MMSNLRELDPGRRALAALRPQQVRAVRGAPRRWSKCTRSPSLFFAGMEGSRIPVATAHGEGFAEFRDAAQLAAAQPLVALRFVDNRGARDRGLSVQCRTARRDGITGLTTADGRFTILMPHPERVHPQRADVVAS